MSTVWKYGLGMGLVTCAYVMLEYLLGFHTRNAEIGRYTGYLASLIPILGLYLGLREHRAQLGGEMSFREGLRTGIGMTVILAILAAGFFALYYAVINPGAAELYAEMARESMVEDGASEAEIAERLEMIRESQTPLRQFTLALGSTMVFGTLLSAVFAALMRRPR